MGTYTEITIQLSIKEFFFLLSQTTVMWLIGMVPSSITTSLTSRSSFPQKISCIISETAWLKMSVGLWLKGENKSSMCSVTYIENSLSLTSMLRCLMHILVSADPMSLVPPERQKIDNIWLFFYVPLRYYNYAFISVSQTKIWSTIKKLTGGKRKMASSQTKNMSRFDRKLREKKKAEREVQV